MEKTMAPEWDEPTSELSDEMTDGLPSPPVLPPDERRMSDDPEADAVGSENVVDVHRHMLMGYMIAALATCVVLIIEVIVKVRYFNTLSPLVWLTVLGASFAIILWWAHSAIKRTTIFKLRAAQRSSIPVNRDCLWISEKSLHHVLPHLTYDVNDKEGSDSAIQLATRKSQWSWIMKSLLPFFVILVTGTALLGATSSTRFVLGVLTVIAAVVVTVRRKHPVFWLVLVTLAVASLTATSSVPRWIAVVFILVALMWVGGNIMAWHNWYLIVTDRRVYVIVQPPYWLIMMDEVPFPIPYSRFNNCHRAPQSRWGNICRYAKLEADGLGDTDNDTFNNITYIRRAALVANQINLQMG
jgi:hypothetical protein